MVIGIDASRAVADRPTGTEIYSQRLIQTLLKVDTPHRFRLYLRADASPQLFEGAEMRILPFPRLWTHVRLSWEMARHRPDLLFVPAHVLPPVRPDLSLVTIHDLGYLRFPEAHPWRQRLYLDLSTRWNARVATHVLADSQATKDDLVARYATQPERVTVAYPGVDPSLAPVRDPAAIRAAKARYGITGDYFLHLGTLQPRKNLRRLVEAFAAFTTRRPQLGASLVVAGKRGWLYDELFEHVRGCGLGGQVHFPGYLADEDKATLMSGALAFVFPSLYEGFGLPVLEAQICGCPVVTSTTSSLPEVAGDGALLVDPQDTAGIADAMERLVSDPALSDGLVERGFANAGRFSWEACAQTILGVIDRMM
ncbi:MAG: glycosyltransferase family 4 protein [Chloroflexota bacterium]